MRDDRDLPEGVIDADPAGGWESADQADGETREQSDLKHDPTVTDGWTSGIPQSPEAAGRGGGTDVGPVEGDQATQGADPDLAADADNDPEEQ